jgi:signal transduction histidine kinase
MFHPVIMSEPSYEEAPRGGRGAIALDDVIVTSRLGARVARRPDHAAENAAYVALARALTEAPETILQRLTDVAVSLCDAGSAGISILEEEDGIPIFRWRAICGSFAPHLGGMLQAGFAPCGTTVERNAPQLFYRPERYFSALQGVVPEIVEALLLPFHLRGVPKGTIWILAHDEQRKFDQEDVRLLTNLTSFASAGFELASRVESSVRAREAAEKAAHGREQLLATVSHDLKTPLTSILGWAQLLQFTNPAPEVRQAADAIASSAKVLSYMVDDLLDASRSNTGQLAVDLRPIDFHDVIREALTVAEPIVRGRGIRMLEALEAPREEIRGDAHRLQQVIWNLLTNAMKFTPSGGEVRVGLTSNGRTTTLTISDNGTGVDAAFLPHMFDQFVRGGEDDSGLGLGLWISRQIIELHGGTISAESEGRGRGTTIRIELPVQTSN